MLVMYDAVKQVSRIIGEGEREENRRRREWRGKREEEGKSKEEEN